MEELFKNYMLDKGIDMQHKRPWLKYNTYFSNLTEYYNYLEDDKDMKELAPKINHIIKLLSEVLIEENEILLDPEYTGDLPKIVKYFEKFRVMEDSKDYTEKACDYNNSLDETIEKIKKLYADSKNI